jgi:hypothetical protein
MFIWQVTSSAKTFRDGSLHLIRGKITTSPARCGTMVLPRGLYKAMSFQNGSHPKQVPFYGFMANVGSFLAKALSLRLTVFSPLAGSGKSILWYVDPTKYTS